jgi:hypothetical protein
MHSTRFLSIGSISLLSRPISGRVARRLAYVLSLSAPLSACEVGSVARECEPVTQEGCAATERCTLGEGSKPTCAPLNPDGLGEGARCLTSEECAEGLGCVERLGVSRCARFCERGEALTPAPASCTQDHPLALCALSLTDRDDIGLCLTPCDPLGADERRACGAGLTCDFSPELPFMECRGEGAEGEWSACGVGVQCAAPLACATEGGEARCAALIAPNTPCPPHTLRRTQPRVTSPEGPPYAACWPSVSVPQSAALGVTYRLSLTPVTLEGAAGACEGWGARLAERPEGGLLESLSRSLSALAAELSEGSGGSGGLLEVWVEGGALTLTAREPEAPPAGSEGARPALCVSRGERL